MFRVVLSIFVCFAVTLIPSYAAIHCAGACDTSLSRHDESGCNATTGAASADDEARDADPSHRDSDPLHHSHHCVASCCGYVAHLSSAPAPAVALQPVPGLLSTGCAQHDAPSFDALFHPPRA